MVKRCSQCKQIKPLSDFYKNKAQKDGHRSYCKKCHIIFNRRYNKTEKCKAAKRKYNQSKKGQIYFKQYYEQYKQSENGKIVRRRNVRNYRIRHPECVIAHHAVEYAVRIGKLLPPGKFKCSYCPQQANEYHHHLGYEPKHYLDVIPICRKCHRKLRKKNERTYTQVSSLQNSA